MGGEQAAAVLATVRRDQLGDEWPAEAEEKFRRQIREQYEDQGRPYYSTARLWDDGVIDPLDTRRVLGPRTGGQRQRSAGACWLRHLPDVTMFSTVLIANRGEIAVRITRTLRRLGVRSVVIYTEADEDARHVREANLALRVRSYLDAEDILSAARESGAEAIHPGYGFLAENAGFARSCQQSGLAFIGPPPEAIARMGDKIEAKRAVAAAGVPVVPGSDERGLSDEANRPGCFRAGAGKRGGDPAQALGRGRRQGDAAGPGPGRSSWGGGCGPARGAGRIRRRHLAGRALYEPTPPYRDPGLRGQPGKGGPPGGTRVQSAAPPPENYRRGAISPAGRTGTGSPDAGRHGQARHGRGARSRLPRRRDGGVHRFRRQPGRLLLHGDEHPTAGGAPGD